MKLARNLTLPPDAPSRTITVLGQKGGGKTYLGMKMAELFLDAAAQIVCFDPTGVWWGLKAEGKGPGFPIIVMGGEHQDIPLAYTSGAVVADFIIDKGHSVVLDLSAFSNAQTDQFVAELCERLYIRKASNRTPLHLMLDEADAFAPQKADRKGWQLRMLGAVEQIVRRGRSRGLGMTMISQRAAVINKNLITQSDLLISMRITGHQDHKALTAWTSMRGTPEQQERFLTEVPAQENGTGFFWSPEWLKCFEQHRVLERRTFDSSSTPEAGKRIVKPKLAPVDLTRLTAEIEATVQQQEDNDPKKLRVKLQAMQMRLQSIGRRVGLNKFSEDADYEQVVLTTAEKLKAPEPNEVEISVFTKDDIAAMERLEQGMKAMAEKLGSAKAKAHIRAEGARSIPPTPARPTAPLPRHPAIPTTMPRAASNGSPTPINDGKRRMMIALAQRPGLNARQLGVRAGLSSSSGTFGTYLSALRTAGWLIGERGTGFELTPAGVQALGSYEPLPSGTALLSYWLGELGESGASRMLSALHSAGRAMTRAELGEAAGISSTSGTFGTYLSKLRTLELIEGTSEIEASPELYD